MGARAHRQSLIATAAIVLLAALVCDVVAAFAQRPPHSGSFEDLQAALGTSPPEGTETRPSTHKEIEVDSPRRQLMWRAGKWTVIVAGGCVLTYFTAGAAAPWVGGIIGSANGLSGAAAVNFGLAFLGGGSVAAGGLGMAGGTAVVATVTDLVAGLAVERVVNYLEPIDAMHALSTQMQFVLANPQSGEVLNSLYAEAIHTVEEDPRLWELVHLQLATALLAITSAPESENIPLGYRVDAAHTAAGLLESLIRFNPNASPAFNVLGTVEAWLSEHELDSQDRHFANALAAFQAGITAEPENIDNFISLAVIQRLDGQPLRAAATLGSAMSVIGALGTDDQAQLLRHVGATQFQLIDDPSRELATLRMVYLAYRESVGKRETADAYVSMCKLYALYLDNLSRAPAGLEVLQLVRHRRDFVAFVEEVSKAADDAEGRPDSYVDGVLAAGYRELLEVELLDSVDRISAAGLSENRDAVNALDEGWKSYFRAVHDQPTRVWPSLRLTQAVRNMVRDSNKGRWKVQTIDLEDYDRCLAAERRR